MDLAPIVLFTYNRPQHTAQTLKALQANPLASESSLFVYSDGPKHEGDNDKISEVRNLVRSIKGFKSVELYEKTKNVGLADSITGGVTEILEKYEKIIVLEDDILTSESFLNYMNDALHMYVHDDRVMHISSNVPYTTGYSKLPNSFFLRYMSCWGWGTWKSRWERANWDAHYLLKSIEDPELMKKFNMENSITYEQQLIDNIEGRRKTWAIKWYTSIFLEGGLCLYPGSSLSANIGLDGSGENCVVKEQDQPLGKNINIKRIQIKESLKARRYFKKYFRYGSDSRVITILKLKAGRIKHKLYILLKR